MRGCRCGRALSASSTAAAAGHTVEVSAESLYEAAALGLGELRRNGFLESAPSNGTRLEVEIRQPAVRHIVTVQQTLTWQQELGGSPAEVIKKERLKRLLK